MCNLCVRKIGNGYADNIMTKFRPVIDAARSAARPRADLNIPAIGGIAASKSGAVLFTDDIVRESMTDSNQADAMSRMFDRCPEIGLFAFESLNNGWLQREVFELLRERSPNAVIMRINRQNGNVQFWDLPEIGRHFAEEVAQTA
jgi:hypothetical protein